MKKIIASIAAAGVLVAGVFTASMITSSEAYAQTDETPAVTDETPAVTDETPAVTDGIRRPHPGGILDGVLSDLVEDGTLEQDQADAVKEALVAKTEELKEKYGDFRERRAERRERRHEMRERIEGWLEDGVISADELAELDVDLPLFEDGPLAEALEDGQITQAEWDAFIEERKANRDARMGENQDSAIG